MSLINDALKKVSKPGNTPTPPPGAPMQPADPQPPDYGKLLLSIFVLIVLVLVAGTFFWWKGNKGAEVAQNPRANDSATSSLVAPLDQTKNVASNLSRQNIEGAAVADTIASSTPVVQPATNPAPATRVPSVPAASTQTVAAAVAPSDFPDLKLHAIYYRLRGPTVVINGKTLKIGDEIEGAKVTQILRTSTELEYKGKKKTLTMR
jgi:cytoskeletal protein RodZ